MVSNGYIRPLVLYGGFGYTSASAALNMYNGGNPGNGYYPDNYVLMMLKNGYELRGFQAYTSANSSGSDGYYVRTVATSNFRVVLK